MKRVLTAAACLLLVTVNTQAQGPGHPGKHHRGEGGIFHQLNLSEDQKAELKTQREAFKKQMEALKKKEDITVKEWRQQKETLLKQQHEQMQSLLTADQKAQLEKMKKDRKAMREVHAKARMEKMKIKLGLSNEQSARLEKQRTALESQLKAIRESQADRNKKHEQVKELMQKHKEDMKSVLTEEQKKKMEEMRKQHGGRGKGKEGRQHPRGVQPV